MLAQATKAEQFGIERRANILSAARWCFLNFGYGKTSIEDVAKRAGISRPLVYRMFRDKEDLFVAVYNDFLVSPLTEAKAAAHEPGKKADRLNQVCEIAILRPWAEMVKAPMACEFTAACVQLDPEVEAKYRESLTECAEAVLGDAFVAEVFVLALEGLRSDEPQIEILQPRIALLIEQFVCGTSRY